MRVLFVSHKFPPQKGGVGVSARRISSSLSQWCETVHVLHCTREPAAGTVLAQELEKVTVFTLGEAEHPAEREQLLESTIRALHQRFDYQVVVGFYAIPTGFTAVFAASLLGLPSVLCLRGNDIDRAIYMSGQMAPLNWALKAATRVVTVSREMKAKAELLSGRDDVVFIANSVDSDRFRPLDDVSVRPRHLLFSGEMRLKKGSEILFPSLAELSGEWTLTVAGGFRGQAEGAFRKWAIRNRELASRVTTLPYAHDPEELCRLYNEADLVLNPALWDGMPNSVLEAMACQRPVLTTGVGGLRDLIEDGVNGYLLELSDLGELGSKISAILEQPERLEIASRARETVVQKHSPCVEGEAYHRLLSGLA